VFIGIMTVFVLLMYWNAEQLTGWAGGLVFALQTTNEPGITAGIVAVGGMAIGLIAVGGLAVGILVGKWEGNNAGMLECWNAGMLGCRDAGMMRCWNAGMLGCWDAGMLAPVKSALCKPPMFLALPRALRPLAERQGTLHWVRAELAGTCWP
jgi:hypothetical protein